MIIDEEAYLEHYGILRKSGRYPWNSGETQNARNKMFLDTIEDMKKQGMKESEIAAASTDEHKITSTTIRDLRSVARNEQRQSVVNQIERMADKGMSNVAIGKRMNMNESSVRSAREAGRKHKLNVLDSTTKMLRDEVDEKTYVQIGRGVENHLGLTSTKLGTAITALHEEGYQTRWVKVPQLGTGEFTTVKVLAKPGAPFPKIEQVQLMSQHTRDGGETYAGTRRPESIDIKRVDVNYAETGGAKKDGLIELRPGVPDLSMGSANYAQVRMAVNGSHYIKGMAVYNKDLPAGVDVRFNTNKKNTGNKLDALKPMERKKNDDGTEGGIDLDNPFTASIKPGGQRGKLNIIYEEGDWESWSKSLPSQMLSKQRPDVAKTQLDLTYAQRKADLAEISALTNPTIKKKLLETYANETDSAAVHLEAAHMPRQASRVLIPVSSVKDTEIYAPSFRNGERVALVRFPHGGTFEIPVLTVNNKNAESRRILGSSAKDAVGINSKVAERLSGADFDGDYALVIPNTRGDVRSTPALEGLKGFDPRKNYPAYDGMRTIDGGVYSADKKKVIYPPSAKSSKQQEMGKVTNLIADMTVLGANTTEIAAAVRHSMVVIDAEKHGLDYKGSAKANGIPALKEKYQGSKQGGASTLITKAGSPDYIAKRKPRRASLGGPVDRATGKKVYEETGETYVNKKGKTIVKTDVVDKLSVRDDAHTLVSGPNGTRIERIYADHSNKLKALANEARKEGVNTPPLKYSSTATKVYAKDVATLDAKLDIAKRNAPLERQAQIVGTTIVNQKKAANPNMDSATLRKVKNKALVEARIRTGAGKKRIDLTPEEWAAIQAGAISDHKLQQILANANIESVRKLATPRTSLTMTSVRTSRARAMLASGYTQAEVADTLGVSLTTLKTSLA